MMEALNRHPNDEEFEQYALGTLRGIATFEQHLLICPACQDRMAEMDASVQAIQAEARAIRLRERPGKAMCCGSASRS